MNAKFKILTLLGSPHDSRSNTRALVEDFVAGMSEAGLNLEHVIIPLGRKTVKPCIGCWNCTRYKPCPLASDDLHLIKEQMLACDMLILACPVYTNQVTAQMKALFDRLFTWCHIFPLLGKFSLSAVTTGNEGHEATASFLEKMLATYGTFSLGTISSIGAFTPGFFPFRAMARKKNKKLAAKAVRMIIKHKKPAISTLQKKIFRIMKNKMTSLHALNCMQNGVPQSQPDPDRLKIKIFKYFFKKLDLTESEVNLWGDFLSFELSWWRKRGWLQMRSFQQLVNHSATKQFDLKQWLLDT